MLYHKASIVTALLPMICRSFAAEPVEENADQTVRQGSGGGQTIPVGLGDASIKTVDIDDGFNVTDGTEDYKTLTTYKYYKCSKEQKKVLKQAAHDAINIAYAGISFFYGPGGDTVEYMSFDKESAIDFFGPLSKIQKKKNRFEEIKKLKRKIYTTVSRSAYSYRGTGWSDWWNSRYVQLSCDTDLAEGCASGTTLAIYSNIKIFSYPLITFCDVYFNKFPSFAKVIEQVEYKKDPQRKMNSLNLRNQATTMLHEWIHINWGAAEVCPGGAIDWKMQIGPPGSKEEDKAYRPGKAKLLAKQNYHKAASNNDNYVFFCLSSYMARRWGTYPQYPSAWDPVATIAENEKHQASEPGYPPQNPAIDKASENDPDEVGGAVVEERELLDAGEYPEWYRPKLTATRGAMVPEITPPPDATSPPPDTPTSTID